VKPDLATDLISGGVAKMPHLDNMVLPQGLRGKCGSKERVTAVHQGRFNAGCFEHRSLWTEALGWSCSTSGSLSPDLTRGIHPR